MKTLIAFFCLCVCWQASYAQSPDLMARYPLTANSKDILEKQYPAKLLGTSFEGGGTRCAGTYADYDAGKGNIISAEGINIDLENFSIRLDFKTAVTGDMTLFSISRACRHFLFALTKGGKIMLACKNNNIRKESSLAYKNNTWHTATLTVKKNLAIAYLDGVEVCRLNNVVLNQDCAKDYGAPDISTTNFSNANCFNGFWRDLRVYKGIWTPQTKEEPLNDKPSDNPIVPSNNTALGSWRSHDFKVAGKPNTTPSKLGRSFFSFKNAQGNLEVIWQAEGDLKVYVSRFDAKLENPQHIALPTPPKTSLLAATNDENGNYYYAMVKTKTGNETNDLLTLCKADKNGKKIVQQAQSSDAKDLDIWDMGHWAGTMRYHNGALAFFLARRMNKYSDGLNHQGGIAVLFDANTLKVIKNFGQTSGHSFDNFLMLNSQNEFIGMDLGDNYPRGINLHKFTNESSYIQKKLIYTFKTYHGTTPQSPAGRTYPKYDEISTAKKAFYKWSNDNGTYTELGNIIEVADGYLVIFAGEPDEQGKSINNARIGDTGTLDARNLGFIKVRKDFEKAQTLKEAILSKGLSESSGFYTFGGTWSRQENEGVTWLTKHKNPKTENVCHIKALSLPNGNILLLYNTESSGWSSENLTQPYMMSIDAQGKIILPATTLDKNISFSRRDEAVIVGKRVIIVQGISNNGEHSLRLHTLELK